MQQQQQRYAQQQAQLHHQLNGVHHLSPRSQAQANAQAANGQLNGFAGLVAQQQQQHEQQSPTSSSQATTNGSPLQHALTAGHHGASQHQLISALQAQQNASAVHLSQMGQQQRARVESFYSHAANGYNDHKGKSSY